MHRRQFLSLSLKTALGLGAGAGVLSLGAAFDCVVHRRPIFLPGLPAAFDGFRVALLSDFHHSPWISSHYIRRTALLANSLHPDLIALTGDFVDRDGSWAAGCFEALACLRARHGIVAVLGNHDFYGGASKAVKDALGRSGFIDLTNRGISLRDGGETLHIGGTGDLWQQDQKLDEALAGVREPKSALLLQHNPDYVETIHDERVGLVLSGHTHGGQCVFPFIGAPIVPSGYGQKYASGLCQGPVAQVFVTRGIGTVLPPIRFRCPPEVALLTLRRGHQA